MIDHEDVRNVNNEEILPQQQFTFDNRFGHNRRTCRNANSWSKQKNRTHRDKIWKTKIENKNLKHI